MTGFYPLFQRSVSPQIVENDYLSDFTLTPQVDCSSRWSSLDHLSMREAQLLVEWLEFKHYQELNMEVSPNGEVRVSWIPEHSSES